MASPFGERREHKTGHNPQNLNQIPAAKIRETFPRLMCIAATKPEKREEIQDMLTTALKHHCEELERQHRIGHLFTCYEEALKFYPHSAQISNNLGAHLFRLHFYQEAATYFRRSLTLDPQMLAARENLDKVALALVERWHFPMLNDTCRNGKFANAIRRAVASGHLVVLDIGSGTAIFSMVAANCGAKQVYACEASKAMADISRDILQANGFHPQERVKILNMMSTELKIPEHIPERVHLVVTETLDAGLFGENILTTLSHAWEHLLLPPRQGKVIPSSATLYMALVESTYIRNYSRISSTNLESLDISGLKLWVNFQCEPYTTESLKCLPGGFRFLSTPCQLLHVDFNDPQRLKQLAMGLGNGIGSILCEEEGIFDAMAVWFHLQVDEENKFTTHPNSNTCWEQAIFPITGPPGRDILLSEGSKVFYEYNCKEAMQLKWSQINSPDNSTAMTNDHECPSLHLTTKDILVLNQPEYLQLLTLSLLELQQENSSVKTVLDTHEFPIWGLLALKKGVCRHCFVSDKYKDTVENIRALNDLSTTSLSYVNLQMVLKSPERKFDCIFMDLLDPINGSLNSHLQEIPLILKKNGIILPYKIDCVGYLVESEDLWSKSRVVGDHHTLQLKISEHINTFKVRNHFGIPLSTLQHTRLSGNQHVLRFDLNERDFWSGETRTLTAKILTQGKLTAFVYWFEIQLTKHKRFSTFSSGSNYLQAAVIVDEQIDVTTDTLINIKSCIVDGEVRIDIIKVC